MRATTIHYGFGTTPVGPALAAWTKKGLCVLRLMAHDRQRAVAQLQARYPDAELVADDPGARKHFRQVQAYLAGQATGALPLDLQGTPFQKKVWQALRAIPHGQTRSYREIARQVGKPRAARAVGNACAANPVGILVPCHRVLASDGSLGGYGWGLKCKRQLLQREQCRGLAPPDGNSCAAAPASRHL